jgi:hypothetical protein
MAEFMNSYPCCCPLPPAGFDQASPFALLEHADEAGRVEDSPRAGTSSRPADQPARGRQNSQGGQGRQQHGKGPTPNTAGRPAAAPAQAARAEDYYRAFEHVFRDPSSGTGCLALRQECWLDLPAQLHAVAKSHQRVASQHSRCACAVNRVQV